MSKQPRTLNLESVLQITMQGGGHYAARCTECGARGWIVRARYGWPHGAKKRPKHELMHAKDCPAGAMLTPCGKMKRIHARPKRS